jgi:hypothetical protein
MRRLRTLACLALAGVVVFLACRAHGGAYAPAPVPIEFYFEAGCAECQHV